MTNEEAAHIVQEAAHQALVDAGLTDVRTIARAAASDQAVEILWSSREHPAFNVHAPDAPLNDLVAKVGLDPKDRIHDNPDGTTTVLPKYGTVESADSADWGDGE